MRVVVFDGRAVKKQTVMRSGAVRLFFYEQAAPQFVTIEEWRAGAQNLFFPNGTCRSAVVRDSSLINEHSIPKKERHDERHRNDARPSAFVARLLKFLRGAVGGDSHALAAGAAAEV